jgi:hypothetical protein
MVCIRTQFHTHTDVHAHVCARACMRFYVCVRACVTKACFRPISLDYHTCPVARSVAFQTVEKEPNPNLECLSVCTSYTLEMSDVTACFRKSAIHSSLCSSDSAQTFSLIFCENCRSRSDIHQRVTTPSAVFGATRRPRDQQQPAPAASSSLPSDPITHLSAYKRVKG